MDQYKTCTKCGQTKPRTNEYFYKNQRSPDGLRPDCSACGKKRSNSYASENRQRARDRANEWRMNNLERKKVSNRNWYEKNKKTIRAEWKEKYHADPERYKVSSRVRRARVKGVPFERYRVEDVIDRYGTICHLCNKEIDLSAPRQMKVPGWQNGLHMDHVIPISKNGPDVLDNIRPAHGLCNIQRNNKPI